MQFNIGDEVIFVPKYPWHEECYEVIPPKIGSKGIVKAIQPDNPVMMQYGLDRQIVVNFNGIAHPIPDCDLAIVEFKTIPALNM